MRLIAITPDGAAAGEEEVINRLFEEGLEVLHLRKPQPGEAYVRELLCRIDAAFHGRIVIHDHFGLIGDFGLKGVHLNRRNSAAPATGGISVSCSCHSFDDLRAAATRDYAFLSPIFDSISKPGYGKAYTHEELIGARRRGLINEKVYALGGVDENTIPLAAEYGFGGVAVLGALWGGVGTGDDPDAVAGRFRKLKKLCE